MFHLLKYTAQNVSVTNNMSFLIIGTGKKTIFWYACTELDNNDYK